MNKLPVDHKRISNEKEHGKWLAENNPEDEWGWGSPAGKLRAKRRADLIIKGGDLKLGKQIMEVGCGTGMFTEKFSKTGANILALDLAEDLLSIAKKRGLSNVEFRLSPFEEITIESSFDAIIGSSVLHHLDMDIALSAIYRLLKPGGKLCFAEPNMLNPQVFIERHFRTFFKYVSQDETAFVRYHLKQQLQNSGFSKINITPFDWLHPSVPPVLIDFVNSIGRLAEMTPFLREGSGSILIVAQK